MTPVFVIIAIALICALARFLFENNKFVKLHPEYNGKYLWSLLYFPGVYLIVLMIQFLIILMYFFGYMSMGILGSLYQNLFVWLVILGGIVLWGMLRVYQIRGDLKEMLMDWQPGDENSALKKVGRIISIGTVLPFLGLFMLSMAAHQERMVGTMIDDESGTSQLQIILMFLVASACGTVIWVFAKRRIYSLTSEIGSKVFNMSKGSNTQPSQSQKSGADKLKEAKGLFDDGILSEEEFNQIKKEILKEGL